MTNQGFFWGVFFLVFLLAGYNRLLQLESQFQMECNIKLGIVWYRPPNHARTVPKSAQCRLFTRRNHGNFLNDRVHFPDIANALYISFSERKNNHSKN